MAVEYVVYIDILFLTDFFLTSLSLGLTAILLRKRIRIGKLAAASGIGSGWNCFLVLTSWIPAWLELFMTTIVIGSLMAVILFGKRQTPRNTLTLLLSSALLGGCMEFVCQQFYLADWEALILLGIIKAVIGITLHDLTKRQNIGGERYSVSLYWKGQSRNFTALADSGNRLCVPETGKLVSLVTYRDCVGFCDRVSGGFYIPYRAVGTEHGLLFAITFEKMEIRYNGICITIDNPVVAIAKEPLSESDDFNMILPEEYIYM